MNKKALIVWGGWQGHEPAKVAAVLESALRKHSFEVEVSASLESFSNTEALSKLDLIVPHWTMGEIGREQCLAVCEAVKNGVGIGGIHGGLCDAFRSNTEWHFMTGGQFVAHPGNDSVKYAVTLTGKHWIAEGQSDFELTTEQYYMHTDPANTVLATTQFPVADGPHVPNGRVDMPVAWVKQYGKGRVFYCAIGHTAKTVEEPAVLRLCTRGLLWAAHAEIQSS